MNEVPLADKITVEICITGCWNTKNYTQGGVANNQCCTCFTILFDEHSFTNQTSFLKSVTREPTAEPH